MPRLTAGDPVLATWLDIQEATNGDPADADLETWESIGFFVRYAQRRGLRCIVLRPSRSPSEAETGVPDAQSGWLIIPTVLLRKLHRLDLETSESLLTKHKRGRRLCPPRS